MDSIITQIFTEQLAFQQMSLWLFVLAFLGGVISSISPCTIGLLPVVIGYVGGYSEKKDSKVIIL